MARYIPKRDEQGPSQAAGGVATPDNPNPTLGKDGTIVERAGSGEMSPATLPMRGGSYGVMPEAIQRVQQGLARAPEERAAGKKARRYVLKEDWRIVINGQVIPTKKGKVYLDTAYDIDHLLAQGAPLECLDPEEPPPATEPEPEAAPEPEQATA